jgi:eukaryotic-like serine/threonine-protein kinase
MMAGEVVADRYELEQLVGSGGMSSVFRAHDRVLERTVALKVLHERLISNQDVVDRFTREAKLVAGLSHTNIVSVIDRGEFEGSPYIVFEYIAGDNLKQVIVRDGPLPVDRALELAIEVARGLAFAHQKGFVHRDVKPQNVLLNGKGEAKVTDFGIARPLEATSEETATGTVLGTCDYIAPEQAQGRHVDAQTDVYSLGIVLFELLTGEVPFTGDNFVAVAMEHINTAPPPVSLKRPDVPPRVEAAVDRALAKEPDQRFATMADFEAELEACLAEVREGGDDRTATGILPALKPRRSPKARKRGRRWPRVLALLALLAAVVVGAVALWQSGGSGGTGSTPPGPLPVSAVSSYDPFGNNHTENPRAVPNATDGNPDTYWSTEVYYTHVLGKQGVGIVVDAGSPVTARTLTVTSTTPGYQAVIRSGDSSAGPFTDDSASKTGRASTTFALDGKKARYYLLWITSLGGLSSVRVNEITATG